MAVRELAPFAMFFRRAPKTIPESMKKHLLQLLKLLGEVQRYLQQAGLADEASSLRGVTRSLRRAYIGMSQKVAPSLAG